MERLTHRSDFLAAATGIKVPAANFVLQARARGDEAPARVGFTVSKKVGNAVERNRVRRRLREVVRRAAAGSAVGSASAGSAAASASAVVVAGHDYVLIGRRAALQAPFDRLVVEFEGALRRAHTKRRTGPAESTR